MFSIKESFKFGWNKFKANLQLSLGSTLIILVLGLLGGFLDEDLGFGSFIAALAIIVASIIIQIGYTKMFLKMADGETPKLEGLFTNYKIFWKYLGSSILVGLIVLGGFILLIIPGIIWALKYSFAQYLVIDSGTGVKASIKESGVITEGSKWKLLGFYILIGLLNMAAAMVTFFIWQLGLIVTVPISMFATIYVYRELGRAKAGILVAPTPISPAPTI